MTPVTVAMTSEADGKDRGIEAVDNAPGMGMEAGIREDGQAGVGETRIGEAMNGRPVVKSGSRIAPQPWTGKVSSVTAEV